MWETIVLIVLLILVGLPAYVWLQFRRFRRDLPRPAFKQPQVGAVPALWKDDEVAICWIGHSTVCLNLFGFRILTDPVWSTRIGVGIGNARIGVKRHTAPALPLTDFVGKVDLILLSHAHMDHFDLPTLRRLSSPNTTVVTARSTGRLLAGMKYKSVYELGDHERITLPEGIEIRAVPVRHWGNRYPWNKNYGWTGYVLDYRGLRVLFTGDTAYTPVFGDIRDEGPIDIAIMPIGAYAPPPFERNHCTPEQAWKMFLESGAKWLVPVHWDTFVLSQEAVEEPLQRLLAAAGEERARVVIRDHGGVFRLASAVQMEASAESPRVPQ